VDSELIEPKPELNLEEDMVGDLPGGWSNGGQAMIEGRSGERQQRLAERSLDAGHIPRPPVGQRDAYLVT